MHTHILYDSPSLSLSLYPFPLSLYLSNFLFPLNSLYSSLPLSPSNPLNKIPDTVR